MESEGKAPEQETIIPPQEAPPPPASAPSTTEGTSVQNTSDRKDDDEEEEEEEEEDKIVEKSHNSRFHKRNKRFPIQIQGVDSAFVAIEPKSGKEVIWNECILSEKKSEKENRYLSIMKRMKRNSHPFLARYLDAWVVKSDDGSRKLVFITERLDECTLKQFLCNSPKNNRSWKRHVGQLLSVLMFLHRLGIPHGNLAKETIYYQNSGNLRVGPFSLGGSLDQKSQSTDVCALGVVALEIAVWTPTEFPQTLSPVELIQQMQARLDNSAQRSFIESCLDPNPAVGNRVRRLINHPAVTEVPILKLLSAKVIVGALRSVTNEEGSATEQTGFATLLKDYVSHYEDETVIVEVHFPHDNIVKSRSWKDFRSNFTLTSKYLEDVKNGFYPLFGCRWNWASYQDEDDESLAAYNAAVANGTTGSSSWLGRVESTVGPSQAYSSGTSTVPSASVSRKHSLATKTSEALGGVPVLVEDEDVPGEMQTAPPISVATGRSSSVCDYPPVRPPLGPIRTRKSDLGISHPPVPPVSRSVSHDEGSALRPGPSFFIGGTLLDAHVLDPSSWDASGVTVERPGGSHSPSPGFHGAASATTTQPEPTVGEGIKRRTQLATAPLLFSANSPSAAHVITESGESTSADFVPQGASLEHKASSASQFAHPAARKSSETKALSHTDSDQKPAVHPDAISEHRHSIGDKNVQPIDMVDVPKGEEAIEEEEDKDEEDDEDENDDEDEDDEDEEKNLSETVDRFEPQTIHVVAPDRAPNHPALFTHCQYFYIGAGRWQVYVQMWFVEERLKREAYVQVFDCEWHDYERVADLFESSRCLNPVDRPSLVRLLSLARHNCPLIDGELHFPGPLNVRSSHFDAFELHEKLTALRLHQQARDQLLRGSEMQEHPLPTDITQGTSVCTSAPDTGQPGSSQAERDTTTAPVSVERQESGNLSTSVPDEVPACADHVFQLQEQQRGQLQPAKEPEVPKEPVVVPPVATRKRLEAPSASNTLFLDVGSLAPRNAYCALCDTHDYLHRVDLPAYLISPCYHCREALAREAKLSPEVLLDLHLQHNIPWPGFLQARFNLPADGRSIEELIAYDCRWRSRQPCRCLISTGGVPMPPCVEFPWLCPPVSTGSSNGSSVTAVSGTQEAAELLKHSTTVATIPVMSDTPAPTETRPKLSEGRSGSPQGHAVVHPSESTISMPAIPTHLGSRGQPIPCSSRHPRGAPTTCSHGIQFPRLGVSCAPLPNRTPPTTIPETCQASNIVTEVPVTNPGGSTHPVASSLLPNGIVS